ncbi:MAG: hypothetical protein ACLGJB_14365 [Blastocatellia bacterium]
MCLQTKIVKFLLLSTLAVAATAVVSLMKSNNNPSAFTFQKINSISRQQKDANERMPVAVYSTGDPSDPKERALRRARNGRYDKRYSQTFEELRPDTKMRSIMSDWGLDLPALPTAHSDAIVLGEVTDSKAYLSNDKTGAYSEFVIQIREVLKNDSRLSSGLVIVEREGAAVQLPDSRIVEYRIIGQGMPHIGGRYILFLKYNNDETQDYHLVTAYELRNGYVLPLDEIGQFTTYKKADEKYFLNAVHAAVANPPKAPERRLDQ